MTRCGVCGANTRPITPCSPRQWLLHREFSEGAGSDHHPLFADLPPIPADVLFRKIANSSAVAFRKLTEDQMVEILRKAPQDYAAMR